MLGLISMMLGVTHDAWINFHDAWGNTHDAWINFHDVHCIIIYSMVLMSDVFIL